MNLSGESLLVIIVVGVIAGWLAGKLVQGTGFGLIGDLVVGIIGALIASWLFPQLGLRLGTGMIREIIDSAIGAISFGYKMDDGLRLEVEDSYDSHSLSSAGSLQHGITGNSQLTSVMANAVYDIPLDDQWHFSVGGGIGADELYRTTRGRECAGGSGHAEHLFGSGMRDDGDL